MGVDLGIVIALKEEFRAFLTLLPAPYSTSPGPETGQHDYVFEHPVTHHRCVVTLIGEMNPGPATLQTERLVSRWSPRTVVMLGIAAGIHSDVRVGDVVIASQVDSYLASAKAQPGSTGESFEFSLGGVVFHADHHLLTQVRNFEFSQPQAFSRWRRDCARVLAELVPDGEVRSALVRQGLVREAPDVLDAHLASDSVVGAAQQFTQWLRKQRDRNLKALDMESAGLMAAAVKRKEPVRTLVLRGISDYGDERKSELDAVREGALRRYAMRNATRLLWELLEAGVLLPPEPGGGKASAGEAPFIGISSASLGKGFKGRERTLEQLHEQLRGAGEVALTSANAGRVFAHGGGGIGKSRLAIEYAYRYQAEYPGGVFFTRVEKRGPLEIWAEFARKVFTERSLPQDEEAALAFAQRLGDPNVGRQLIILDDVQADSRDALNRRFKGRAVVRGHAIWPVTQGAVSLLVTTRMRDISWARSFAVERLEAKAATELLVEKAGRAALAPEEQRAATYLAAEVLGGHPLALSLAGAYIGRGGFSFSEYLGFIREKGLTDRLEEAAKEVGSEIDDHERSIAATYALSRRQLDSGQPEDVLAGRLLRIAAFLEPGVPIDRKLLKRLLMAMGDASEMERMGLALARLTKDLALLDLSQDGGAGPGSVIIHPLIGDYTRWGMQAREREELQHALLSGLLQLFPNSPGEFWRITGQGAHPDWEHLSTAREAHVTAVWRASNGTESRKQIVLSWIIGDLHFSRGNLSRAAEVHQQALERVKRLSEHEADNAGWQRDVSVSLGNLGEVLQEQGNLEGARRAYEQALEIQQRLSEREPDNAGWQRDVSVSLERLGAVLQAQGNLEGAPRAYEQALEIRTRLSESEPDNAGWQRDVSVSLNKLGEVLQAQGNLEGARRACEQDLEIAKRLSEREPDNAGWQRDVSVSLERLGEVLQAQGNLEGARREYEQALEIRTRLSEREPDNAGWQRDVSVSLNKLGEVLQAQGNLEGARRAYEQDLEIAKRLSEREPDNAGWQRDVSVSLNKLGEVLQAQGNLEGARRAYEQALEIRQRLAEREPDHIGWQTDLVLSQSRVAAILVQGPHSDLGEAIRLLTLARDTLRRLTADSRLTDAQQQWLPVIEVMLLGSKWRRTRVGKVISAILTWVRRRLLHRNQ